MTLVSQRYAKALFELALEEQLDGVIAQDCQNTYGLITQSEEFAQFLNNPVIPSEIRHTIIDKTFRKRVNGLFYNFICYLEMKGRLDTLLDVCDMYQSLCQEHRGIKKVTLTSPIKLNDMQKKEIIKHLKGRLKKEIESEEYVDSSMIAGIRIQDGNTVYDYSARTQLNQFRKNLIRA